MAEETTQTEAQPTAGPAAPRDPALAPAPHPVALIVVATVAAAIAARLWRNGALSRRAFEQAPPRAGRMGGADLLIGLGLLIFGQSVAVTVIDRLGPAWPEGSAAWLMLRMLGSQLGALPVIGYVLWRAAGAVRGGLRGFGLAGPADGRPGRWILLGALAVIPLTLAVSVLATALMTLLGARPPMIGHTALRAMTETDQAMVRWGLIGAAVVIAPLVEELVFRGLVQTGLWQSKRLSSRWLVIALASLLFVGIHAGVVQWHAIPMLLVLSIGLGWLYERTGSLWPPIAVHALFNGLQVVVALTLLPSG